MSRILLPSCLAALLLAACDAPPVFATADERQHSELARIEGQVLITGTARGDIVLTLFDAARPPPPEGTGRPIAFEIIPGDKVFGDAAGDSTNNGPFFAPFAFDLVPEGHYLVKGFIDRNGCLPNLGCRSPDFNPWYSVTGEPNAGDVGGAAVDPVTRKVRVIDVARDDQGVLQATTDVTVSFAESAIVPFDRPAFEIEGASGPYALDLTRPATVLKMVSRPLQTDLVHEEGATFFVRYMDANADGVPDDADGNGLPEFWPKVFVKKLTPTGSLLKDDPTPTVLAAGFLPDTVLPLLTNADGTPRMTPVPVSSLNLVIKPLALDVTDPTAPVPLANVPAGRYAVIVMQFTGQTWRIPNELHPSIAEATGLPAVQSQSFFIDVK